MAQQRVIQQKVIKEPSLFDVPAEPLQAAQFQLAISAWLNRWLEGDGLWWITSFVFHLVLVLTLAMIGTKAAEQILDQAPSFHEVDVPPSQALSSDIDRFEIGQSPESPGELNSNTLTLDKAADIATTDIALGPEEKPFDDSEVEKAGGGVAATSNQPNLGGMGFDVKVTGSGPVLRGIGGVGVGVGTGTHPGRGGDELGFGGRGGNRKRALLSSGGGTKQSERAVAGALNWLARHQASDGSWSIAKFGAFCKGTPCSGPGIIDYSSAATALGLLPFLGAGQTHESKGPYTKNVYAGVFWLLKNQQRDGDLRVNGNMYAHGLAAIALCECYGMTNSKQIGRAAQGALNFIVASQDAGGGWRYKPQEPGDTSVTGWQIMALKSGQMAHLEVSSTVFDKARSFLASASSGDNHGMFKYLPTDGDAGLATTAVGLLCQQYMHMPRSDPAMIEGTTYLMQHLPHSDAANLYYWYYATQVMHNVSGADWDTWNRKMRRLLIDTQTQEGCAAGSWDPKPLGEAKGPENDVWGNHGGRLMMTSLGALTLEVYYRYLPLYQLDQQDTNEAVPDATPSNEAT